MNTELDSLRALIDKIDLSLIGLLEERMTVSAQLASFKKRENRPVFDPEREKVKFEAISKHCLPETEKYILSVFRTVVNESKNYQTALLEEDHV